MRPAEGSQLHELSIAQSIVDSALEHASRQGARRVTRVGVRVGDISGVNAEALEFCFGMTTRDTSVAGAVLDVERVPVSQVCEDCGRQFQPVDFDPACPDCRSVRTRMVGGTELALAYLEFEE